MLSTATNYHPTIEKGQGFPPPRGQGKVPTTVSYLTLTKFQPDTQVQNWLGIPLGKPRCGVLGETFHTGALLYSRQKQGEPQEQTLNT